MSRNWPRLIIVLMIGAFFAFRWWALGGRFHAIASVTYILASLAGLLKLTLTSPKHQTLILNVGISLVFLDLVFAQIEWSVLLDALAAVNYAMLLPSFALVVVSLVLRTWRWQWLLRAVGRVPFGPAFRATNIGVGANMVLPARAGEFLRAYVIGRSTGISKAAAFATLVVERIFDGFTILLSLVAVVLVVGVRSSELKRIGFVGGVFYIGVLVAVSVFYFRQTWFNGIVERLTPERWAPRASALLQAFANGLAVLRDRRQLLVISLQSLIIWSVIALSFYPVLLAFDLGSQVPLFTPFLMLPLIALGLTIPGAPGDVGILQLMTVLALQLSLTAVGAEQPYAFAEQAAAFSLVLHFSQAAPEIVLGAWAFMTEGLTWNEVEMGREAATG
jgi:uncharacterized protein (TIRG00374 family)